MSQPRVFGQPRGRLLGEEGADRFRGQLERRIVQIHDHVAQQRRDPVTTPAHAVQRDRDQRPQLSLGHGPQAEQRHLRHLAASQLLLDREIADLRPVAVYDDDPPAGVEQCADGHRHRRGVGALLLVGALLALGEEGVAANGDHRGPGHDPSLPWTIGDANTCAHRPGVQYAG